jgi:hypothetical protein
MTTPTQYPHPSMPITPKMQERIRAEGWRPPPDILDSVEAVGLLRLGTIVKSGVYAYHRDRMGWFRTGTPAPVTPPLPVTVLWTPDDVTG